MIPAQFDYHAPTSVEEALRLLAEVGGSGQDVKVHVKSKEGEPIDFLTTCRIDTPVEIEYYRNGGILHTVLRNMLRGAVKT